MLRLIEPLLLHPLGYSRLALSFPRPHLRRTNPKHSRGSVIRCSRVYGQRPSPKVQMQMMGSTKMALLQMDMARVRRELLRSKIWRKKSPNHQRCYLKFHSGGQLRETPSLRHLYHHHIYPPTTASKPESLREIETRAEIVKLAVLVSKPHPYDRHPCHPPLFISRPKRSLHLIHSHLLSLLHRHLMWRLLYRQQEIVVGE